MSVWSYTGMPAPPKPPGPSHQLPFGTIKRARSCINLAEKEPSSEQSSLLVLEQRLKCP